MSTVDRLLTWVAISAVGVCAAAVSLLVAALLVWVAGVAPAGPAEAVLLVVLTAVGGVVAGWLLEPALMAAGFFWWEGEHRG